MATGGASERYNIGPGRENLPQVEPEAGYWVRCRKLLRQPTLDEIRGKLGAGEQPFPPAEAEEAKELQKLVNFFAADSRPVPANAGIASTSAFLNLPVFYSPAPAGAVLSTDDKTGLPVLQSVGGKWGLNGAELASLFEAETPGLWHRHVLNVLLDPSIPPPDPNDPNSRPRAAGLLLSPPRQALIWAALDLAIEAALSAAWNYKWIAEGVDGIDFRRRPAEYARDVGVPPSQFQVLYDLQIVRTDSSGTPTRSRTNGRIQRTPAVPKFGDYPGTPRHPAYPSGHSTYAAAASHVLGELFRGYADPRFPNVDLAKAFDDLALDIGQARLHGGVHWQTDDDFGRKVGKAVGALVLEQLAASGIPVASTPYPSPPSDPGLLEEGADQFAIRCGEARGVSFSGMVQREVARAQVLQNLQIAA